jgi:hypothetical protein
VGVLLYLQLQQGKKVKFLKLNNSYAVPDHILELERDMAGRMEQTGVLSEARGPRVRHPGPKKFTSELRASKRQFVMS